MVEIYTVPEVAKILKVKKGYVYELIYKGELRAIRLSARRFRITEESLLDFLKRVEADRDNETD